VMAEAVRHRFDESRRMKSPSGSEHPPLEQASPKPTGVSRTIGTKAWTIRGAR
jgi:hypothetical protein